MSTVERIEWGIMPPDEIRSMSVCNITNDFQSRMKYGDAANDSLCDRRMGPLTSTETCLTCKRTGMECPGHFGRIELATEVISDHFMQAIRRAIKSICTATPNCPGIAGDAPYVDDRARAEADAAAAAASTGDGEPTHSKTRCPECKKRLPKIRTGDDGVSFVFTWKDRSREDMCDATAVRELFLAKPAETWRKLGYDPVRAHPASMIMTVLPVLPTNARPYCPTAKGWNASDVTSSYGKIVHANEELKSKIVNGRPAMIVEQAKSHLRHAVRVLYDARKMVGKNGRPITVTQRTTGLNQRIGGKNGRLRLNCMGGRVDFTGRTVITADPKLRVNEIGLPQKFAETLTIPEAVNDFNIADMRKLVRDKRIKLLKKRDGSEVHLEECAEIKAKVPYEYVARTLAKGDVVHRPIRNGDVILLNRQPSLHKASIMAFYVRLMPGLTIRFNMSCCTPFNADFDGDEMNIHVPQTLQARVEAELLMSVQSNIISPQNNRPIMALIYDALLGAREMSLRTTFLDETLMSDVVYAVDDAVAALPFPTVFARKKDAPSGGTWGDAWNVMWSGKSALSAAFPKSFTYGKWREDDGRRNDFGEAIASSGFTHFANEKDEAEVSSVSAEEKDRHRIMLLLDDKLVRIRHGEFLTGELSKATMGTRTGGLVHHIFNDAGPEACADFLSNIQFLINKWLESRGYSISITHGFIPDRDERVERIRKTIADIRPDMTEDDKMAILNGARDAAGKNLDVSDTNPFISMIVAGSKGDVINFIQTSVCLGQQSLYGKRIPMTLNDGTRGLPHFPCGFDLPIGRGFVESSFTKGLNPFEFWNHAAGGRQGIIDTAIKTADSGYISRQFVKRLENVTVAQDGMTRKTNNELVSVNYGDDGFSGTAFMPVSFRSVYSKDPRRLAGIVDREEAEALLEAARTLDDYERRFVDRAEKDPSILLPFSLSALELASEKFQRMLLDCPPMNARDDGRWVFEMIKKTLVSCREEFEPCGGNDPTEDWMGTGNPLINALFLWNYNSATILSKNWSRMRLLAFCEDFHTAYRKAKAPPYEAVGAIAAQSMGEPATQMTLNSFHFAGLSTMNVSSGMPRLKELVHASTEDATPIMVFTTTDTAAVLAAARNVHLANCVVGRPRLCLNNSPEDVTPSWEHRFRACFTRKRGGAPAPKAPKRRRIAAIEDGGGGEDISEDAEDAFLDNPVLAKEAEERRAEKRAVLDKETRALELTAGDTADTFHITMELDERTLRRSKLSLAAVCEAIEKVYPTFECIHSHETMRTGEPVRFERPFIKVTTDFPASQYAKAKIASKKMLLSVTLSGLTSTEFETQRISDTQISVRCKTKSGLTKVQSKRKCPLNPIVESWALENVGIDHTKTYSNSIHTVHAALGIEASRTVLERELSKVLKYGGSYVNSRHLKLLCDTMCCEGRPVSIKSKKVFEGRECSTLGMSTYESSVPIVTQGAIAATVDELHDTSARIAVGARMEVGTSSKIKILMDEEKYARLTTYGALSSSSTKEMEEDTEEWQGFLHAEQRAWRDKIPVFDGGDRSQMPFYAFSSDDEDGDEGPRYVSADDDDDEGPRYVPADDGPKYVPADDSDDDDDPKYVPQYSPSSPTYGGNDDAPVAPRYSPSSPTYTPTSPAASPDRSPVQAEADAEAPEYSPDAKEYSPKPKYTPRSPFHSPPPPIVQLGYDEDFSEEYSDDDDDDPILRGSRKRRAKTDPFADMFNRKRVK